MIPDRYTLNRTQVTDLIWNNGAADVSISPVVQSITWSGDNQQATRKLEVSFTNTRDGESRLFNIAKGDEIRLLEDGVELFRGVIFADTLDMKGSASLTAYDENIYLTKNKDSRKLSGRTASTFIKSVCVDYGIPVGDIEDTGYVIPKLVLREKTLYEMFVTALTVTYRQNGRKFSLGSKDGKLILFERKKQVTRFVLERGANILEASYTQSIEDMRTKVKVVGEAKSGKATREISKEVKSDALIKKYGIMQHLESASGTTVTESSLQQLAVQILAQLGTIKDDARIKSLGISEVTAGKAVYVYEPMTGIQGGYYVASDSHTWSNGSHMMDVTLSATDDIPLMEYEPPAEKQGKSKRGKSGKGGGDVDYIFNASGVGS